MCGPEACPRPDPASRIGAGISGDSALARLARGLLGDLALHLHLVVDLEGQGAAGDRAQHRLLHPAVDDAREGHVSVLHDDADGRIGPAPVALEESVTVDLAVELAA